ncbi:MAG: zinc-binding dehydrogenase [Deinococcales bacterium]
MWSLGAAPIGLAAIAHAKAAGASQIIAADVSETRLEMAQKMGASSAFCPQQVEDISDLLLS